VLHNWKCLSAVVHGLRRLDVFAVQERSVFRRIVLKNAYNRRKMFEELLESVPLLKSLNVRACSASFQMLVVIKTNFDICAVKKTLSTSCI